jgi:hypothetical protein
MGYPEAALERATTVQQVMLKAISGEIHWLRVADGAARKEFDNARYPPRRRRPREPAAYVPRSD